MDAEVIGEVAERETREVMERVRDFEFSHRTAIAGQKCRCGRTRMMSEVVDFIGSSGRTRTYNPSVNSPI